MLDARGTWAASYGEQVPIHLMEYAYASAVERIARAGQAEYALPMYVNAWLEQFPWRSGGLAVRLSGGAFYPRVAGLCALHRLHRVRRIRR